MKTVYTVNNKESSLMGSLGMIVFSYSISLLFVLIRGWTLSLLWAWFVVPTFTGIPSISIPQALGLSLIASVFVITTKNKNKEKEDVKLVNRFIGIFILALLGVRESTQNRIILIPIARNI